MTFAAVVVTYERDELLVEVLKSLHGQSASLDEVIVVNNGANPRTRQVVRRGFPHVTILDVETNEGGAGGFSRGVALGVSQGHEALWLMDDDALPARDAFERLRDVWNGLDSPPAFLASLVTNLDGAPLNTHRPTGFDTLPETELLPIGWAPFVGVLVSSEAARRTAAPCSDFFLCHDDVEYTSRLTRFGSGFLVRRSLIAHPDKSGLRLTGSRFYLDCRNRIWLGFDRRLGSAMTRRRARRRLVAWSLLTLVQHATEGTFAKHVVLAWWHGLTQRPDLKALSVAKPTGTRDEASPDA